VEARISKAQAGKRMESAAPIGEMRTVTPIDPVNLLEERGDESQVQPNVMCLF
jgi:hypothetical protein